MNPPRTTYQSDFSSYDWLQNNFSSDVEEFCGPDNVDDCLKYISRELNALGYPSIYSPSSNSPLAVNCDIVKLLNAIYELLRSWNEHAQNKEVLECRNQRLSADFNVLHLKNNQLKGNVEQLERKLANALERERQLKEKYDLLAQSLKNEKEETKRLSAQIRQQKVAYQHEIRKHENNINQVQAKLSNLLADKAPNKKFASLSMSQPLSRNTGSRSKWKTSSSASSAMEEMYSSVISNYEARSEETYKEVLLLRHFLQSILLQIMDVVSLLQGDDNKTDLSSMFEDLLLSVMSYGCNEAASFDEKFICLFDALKEIASNRETFAKETLENEIASLKSKVYTYENYFTKFKETQKENQLLPDCPDLDSFSFKADKISSEDALKEEKKKLDEEKIALAEAQENLEKEKARISAQKLAVLKLVTEQKSASKWQPGLSAIPSLTVTTSKDGRTTFSNLKLTRPSSNSPDSMRESPLSWNSNERTLNECGQNKSDSMLLTCKRPASSPSIQAEFDPSDLPSWANSNSNHPESAPGEVQIISESSESLPAQETEFMPDMSSSENIQLLQAALLDLERRKKTSS